MGKLKPNHLETAKSIVQALRIKTMPLDNHNDSGAIQNSWSELEEIIEMMTNEIKSGWNFEDQIYNALNVGDGVYRP